MPDAAFLADLRAALGPGNVLTGDRVRERALDPVVGPVEADVLVKPRDTAQVSAVLRLCHARGQPVVPHGGLTGLVHGAVARKDEIVLSLAGLDAIELVDAAGRTLRAGAGVTLQRVQEEAERHELMFPLDLGARGSATIGGNIATNAGGTRVVRYGMIRSLVLGLEAVLADGTVVCSLNRMLKNNAGYDLKQLFIGSEGTLGVVTRADLRLVPLPRSHDTAFVACADFEAVVRLLRLMDARLGGQLSAFEVLWPEYYALTTSPPAPHAPLLAHGQGLYVLLESLGAEPEADHARMEQALAEALDAGALVDAVIAKSDAERRVMWTIREDVWQTRRYGLPVVFDVSLAVQDMPQYVAALRSGLAERLPRSRAFVFGHLADGNLHVAVTVAEHDAATVAAVERCVYEPLCACGGSISAEHGIGLERKDYLAISRTPAEIATMRALKAALDPRGILNRGKIFDMA